MRLNGQADMGHVPVINQQPQVNFPTMTAQQQLGALYQQVMHLAMTMGQNHGVGPVGWAGQRSPYPSYL